MHEETLYLRTKQVLKKIQDETMLKKFYLAGGTALALHLGHRKSIDLDFFSDVYPAHAQLLQTFAKYNLTIAQQDTGTLDLFIDDVKVSFFEYKYPLLKKTFSYEKVDLASVLDIACMKIVAIAQRGTKKDFVDLFVILKNNYSLEEIFNAFDKKYVGTDYQKLHILKSLVYFADAENDPEPDYLTSISWKEVKDFLTSLAV